MIAVTPSAGGNLRTYPDGTPTPGTTTLTYQTGQTIDDQTVIQVAANGKIDITNTAGTTNIVINITGYYPTGPTLTSTTWSYPDLHSNYTITTTDDGTVTGGPNTYDPWGQPTPGQQPLHNTNGATRAAFGTAGKLTDPTSNITILGARAYNPTEARFLTVDPIQGGCANPYVYGFGDPVNHQDLSGKSLYCADKEGSAFSHIHLTPGKAALIVGGAIIAAGFAAATLGIGAAFEEAAASLLEEEQGFEAAWTKFKVISHRSFIYGPTVTATAGGVIMSAYGVSITITYAPSASVVDCSHDKGGIDPYQPPTGVKV